MAHFRFGKQVLNATAAKGAYSKSCRSKISILSGRGAAPLAELYSTGLFMDFRGTDRDRYITIVGGNYMTDYKGGLEE